MNTPHNRQVEGPHTTGPNGRTPAGHPRPDQTRRGYPTRRRPEIVAREHTGDYHHDAPGDDSDAGEVGPGLRDKIGAARQALREVLAAVSDEDTPQGGDVAGLLELLGALDAGHAAAVELTGLIQQAGTCERRTGLPLNNLLAFKSRAPHAERGALANAAEQLPTMPYLRRAVHAGLVGWSELRAILSETRALNGHQRRQLDAGFKDLDRLARWEPDQLIDTVRDAAATLRPKLDRDRTRRVIEHRFFALQPALDGAGTGYFELDPAAFAPVAEAIQAAMPAPSAGPNDISRHAPDHDPAGDSDEVERDQIITSSPEGDPAFADPVLHRSRARQRADALVRLAEVFLAGQSARGAAVDQPGNAHTTGDTPDTVGAAGSEAGGPDAAPGARNATNAATTTGTGPGGGPLGRARPSLQAICDIGHLTGHDETARAAQALIATIGGPVRLTPEAVRRLACDAKLQLIFTDRGQVLGTTDPTDDIPIAVRRAVQARDRGCRFPGCSAPIHWADLHHVIFRSDGGSTTPDNLVALCRRHHTAVHEGGWKLHMATDGTVTVKRGRHTHTADPPWRRTLLPD